MKPPRFSKLARAIAHEEGFGRPGKIPTTHHNPGDLRHSPHSHHSGDPEAIGEIDTDEHGWEDLERQILLDARRGKNLRRFIDSFAPPSENDTGRYLRDVCAALRVHPDTPLTMLTDVDI